MKKRITILSLAILFSLGACTNENKVEVIEEPIEEETEEIKIEELEEKPEDVIVEDTNSINT